MTKEQHDHREYLLKYIRISAEKKLEWLYRMHELTNACATKKYRTIWLKLREAR